MESINQITQNYEFLNIMILGNLILDWFIALGVFFVAWVVLKIFKAIIVSRLKKLSKKTKTDIDDMVINAIAAIHWPFYFLVSIYFALKFVVVHGMVQKMTYVLFLAAIVYYALKFAERIINYGTEVIIKRKEDAEENVSVIRLLNTLAKVILWIGAIVLILSNLGYDVTSLVAGLGIGGIAIALALQNILGDLFSSLTIYFDKPFKVGDMIALGDQIGTVTKVGLKTTRIQVPQGEELVVANSELTKSQLRNFGVMKRRRALFNIGVTYDTPVVKMKKIPDIIKKIIEKEKDTETDRVHFKNFGDFSLGFEIVYYYNSGEYSDYLDAQQRINLAIMEQFEKEGIEMAFPTQTIHVEK